VPATVTALSGGSKYSNFDTNLSIMYQYQVQTPDDAVDTIKNYSGRVEGGDLKWEFDNATEDTNYAVIPGLRSAIDNYVGTVVRVLGINGSSQSSETPITPEPTTPTESTTPAANVGASYKKTFDNGVSDTVFTITGSLKSDVASKTYDGVTYTSALKMEKSTSITFTLDAAYTLVIVTDSSSKKIKIDDNNKTTDSNGVYTIDLASGSHTITKGDSMNVYALILIKK
jgi:pectate lyase